VLGWVSRRGWGEARTTRRYCTEFASFKMEEVRFWGANTSQLWPNVNIFIAPEHLRVHIMVLSLFFRKMDKYGQRYVKAKLE
jgi:hypothetical protein